MDLQQFLFKKLKNKDNAYSQFSKHVEEFGAFFVKELVSKRDILYFGVQNKEPIYLIQFLMPLERPFELSVRIEINYQKNNYLIVAQLVRQHQCKVNLGSHDTCLLLIRLFNTINAQLGTNSVFLNAAEKLIKIRHSSSFTLQQFQSNIKNVKKGTRYINEELFGIRDKMKSLLPRILNFINRIEPLNREELLDKTSQSLILRNFIEQIQYQFQKIAHAQATRGRCDGYNRESLDAQMVDERAAEPGKLVLAHLKALNLQVPTITDCDLAEEERHKFLNHNLPRGQSPQDRLEILSSIQYPENSRWEIYDETRFSKIYVGNIRFRYIPPEAEVSDITKCLIKKERIASAEESNGFNRIENQFRILSKIKTLKCLNINRYMYVEGKTNKEICAEYCSYKSLDRYKDSYKQTTSLLTKIFILCHAIQGLRFIRAQGIIHCDIKPGNILLARNLISKICDFGDSKFANQAGVSTTKLSSITPMFSPLEVCYERDNETGSLATKNLDVYSLGMMIYEFIFSRFPFELTNQKLISDKYCQTMKIIPQSKRISTVPEKIINYGPKDIMESITQLCLWCLRDEEEKRPSLDSVIIILRLAMAYLIKMF